MNSRTATAAIIGISIISTAALVLSASAGKHPFPQQQAVEYKVVAIPDPLVESNLNLEGNHGWHVVSARRAMVSGETAEYEFLLERPTGHPVFQEATPHHD